jgi:tripartite-type tricarboxylate transporter receptor subunit TctC
MVLSTLATFSIGQINIYLRRSPIASAPREPKGDTPMTLQRKILVFAATACTALSATVFLASAEAQTFPSRPVTLVVPFPPGGSADILARSVAQRLAKRLDQAVVVENKAGAGTAIGARFVAESAPDGYTLLIGTVSSHAINPALNKVGYDPVADFAVVAPLVSIPFVLVANPGASYATLGDLLAEARRKPGAVSYASAGAGTSNHLAGELLALSANLKLVHVPYRGSAPALADVLGGHVPVMFDLVTTSAASVRAGKLKALAVTGLQRSPLLPEVPTASESGVPGFEISAWFAIFAPSRVPASVLTRLSGEMKEVLRAADMAQSLRDLGGEPDTRSSGEFTAYVRGEVEKYASLLKTAGLSQ